MQNGPPAGVGASIASVKQARAAAKVCKLKCVDGPLSGQVFPCKKDGEGVTIGRSNNNTIIVPGVTQCMDNLRCVHL